MIEKQRCKTNSHLFEQQNPGEQQERINTKILTMIICVLVGMRSVFILSFSPLPISQKAYEPHVLL